MNTIQILMKEILNKLNQLPDIDAVMEVYNPVVPSSPILSGNEVIYTYAIIKELIPRHGYLGKIIYNDEQIIHYIPEPIKNNQPLQRVININDPELIDKIIGSIQKQNR